MPASLVMNLPAIIARWVDFVNGYFMSCIKGIAVDSDPKWSMARMQREGFHLPPVCAIIGDRQSECC